MNYYGQRNYTDKQGINGKYTIAQIGCLLTSFCNLSKRLGKDIAPPDANRLLIARNAWIDVDDGIRDDLNWYLITVLNPAIAKLSEGGGGGWPQNDNSIVKFYYRSPQSGKMTTHFCLVASAANRTIVDSWDGVIKAPGIYGDPVAYASYGEAAPLVVTAIVIPPPALKDGTTYTVVKGDSLSAIAAKFGTTWQVLRDLNDIPDASLIYAGQIIKLPITKSAAASPLPTAIEYEVLPEIRRMHVSKAGGANKWLFGNVKVWTDFVSVGVYPENTNVDVVAYADVPVANQKARYYMDSLALGDFKITGRVANTIGFSNADLSDGHIDPQLPTPTPAPEPVPVAVQEPEPVPEKPVVETPKVEPAPTTPNPQPNRWKGTYEGFASPTLFFARESMNADSPLGPVKELDNRRPDKTLKKGFELYYDGSFIKDGVEYYLPHSSHVAGYWFGVPATNLMTEEEMFHVADTPEEKKEAHQKLTTADYRSVILGKVRAFVLKMFGGK